MRSHRGSEQPSVLGGLLTSTRSPLPASILITFPAAPIVLLLGAFAAALLALPLIAFPAVAQVTDPEALSLSEVSQPVGMGSRSVHDGSSTLREGSVGSMKSRPVHDGTSRSMKSGPVSDISRGPMSEHRSLYGARSMFEASAGAVTKDTASPLGERISAPISELVDLQQILRQRARGSQPVIGETAEEEQLPNDWRATEEILQDLAWAEDELLRAGAQAEAEEGEIDGVWDDDEPSASE